MPPPRPAKGLNAAKSYEAGPEEQPALPHPPPALRTFPLAPQLCAATRRGRAGRGPQTHTARGSRPHLRWRRGSPAFRGGQGRCGLVGARGVGQRREWRSLRPFRQVGRRRDEPGRVPISALSPAAISAREGMGSRNRCWAAEGRQDFSLHSTISTALKCEGAQAAPSGVHFARAIRGFFCKTGKGERGLALRRRSARALEGYGHAVAKVMFGDKGFPSSLTPITHRRLGFVCSTFSKL